MKKLFATIIAAVLLPVAAIAAGNNDGPIEVDWYPLFTDSVGFNIYSGGFVLGWNNTHGDIDTSMGHSVELGWLNVIGAKYNTGHGQRITAGVGIDWRNYKLPRDIRFTPADGDITLTPYPEGATSRSSRLKVFSLTVPVLVRQRIAGKADVFAGPVLCFNLHGSVKTTYKLGDEQITVKSNRVSQVPVTVDLMGGLKWSCIGAYVRYSPCHVLKEAHAPAFTPFTAGIFLGF